MELSHSHRFIFIHVYRCGGESVRAALRPYVYNPGPRLGRIRVLGRLGDHKFRRLRAHRYGHIKAKELREALGPDVFDRYFKFAFIRNPWDWQVSVYHYVRQKASHPDHELFAAFPNFEAYLDWRVNEVGAELQSEFVFSDSGELLMDFVGRFETLAENFGTVMRRLGIDAPLPHENPSRHRDFREYYTPATRALVAEAYKDDIARFGYTFEPAPPPPPIVAPGRRSDCLTTRAARA